MLESCNQLECEKYIIFMNDEKMKFDNKKEELTFFMRLKI